jgi:hypothetical protein
MDIVYCRGGDREAAKLAVDAGMRYGVRYDYTAYGDVWMLDGGLDVKWARYVRRAKKLRPHFALTPDYEKSDPVALELRLMDLRPLVKRMGVCPKFPGAVYEIPLDCVICESIPSEYAGWLIPDNELLPDRDYHLLGGDPRSQASEIRRITKAGGRVVSVDGNKLAMKAAHGQIFQGGRWVKFDAPTNELAAISAHEIVKYLEHAKDDLHAE